MVPPPVEILITIPFDPQQVSLLQGISPRVQISHYPVTRPEDIPNDIWARAEVLYTGRILPTPEQVPNLRWIQFHFAGIDRMVESPVVHKSGLLITTLSGAAASQMAEYTVMMMLALGHRIPSMVASQRKTEWARDRWERFSPLELRNATVGIVGYGSIGRQVARLLQPFGATVLATKGNAMNPSDNGYTPEGWGDPSGDFVHRIYPPQAIRSMVRKCDFLIVCVPLTKSTRGSINAEVLAAMKPSAFLIDVARGGVVDHASLLKALQDNRLAGAALDVFPEEPLAANSPLWNMSNVLITPHIAGNSPHYDERAVKMFSENLHRYLAGMPLYNLFDIQRGY